jgi:hypothetical protein
MVRLLCFSWGGRSRDLRVIVGNAFAGGEFRPSLDLAQGLVQENKAAVV